VTDGELPPPVAYMMALRGLQPWFNAADALGLVRGAWRTGLVQACREPRDVAALATTTGLAPERCAAVAEALVAHDVLDRDDDGRYRVTGAWAPLLLEGPPQGLDAVVRYQLARMRLVEDAVTGGSDYWAATQADRTAYAVGVSVDPEQAGGAALLRRSLGATPEVLALFEAGGTYLELGCGAAGAMAAVLQEFPGISAVGVEVSGDLVEVARDRATRLGIADRMHVVHGDAAAYDGPGGFDFAFWSQFFFPERDRPGALAVLHRCVRPGGFVVAPLMGDPVEAVTDLRTDDGREYAVDRVLHGGWGIPLRSPAELASELEAAGFVEAEVLDSGYARRVRARRP
jgi:SAM-dependent methyltransferase